MKEKIIENKPTVVILSGALLIVLIVLLLFIPLRKEQIKSNKKYFPNYEDIIINEKVVKDKNKYEKVVKQLENDITFNKLLMINDYDSKNASKKDLENMLTNYILLYTIENTKTMKVKKTENGVFCIKQEYLIPSFQELYNTDITEYSDSIIYYFEHAYKRNTDYCFYFDGINKKYGKSTLNSIEKLSYNDGVVTVDTKVYSYEDKNQNDKESKINNLKSAIENKNYSLASSIVTDGLNGELKEKRINFKIFNDGKFFKYQVIDIKTLE